MVFSVARESIPVTNSKMITIANENTVVQSGLFQIVVCPLIYVLRSMSCLLSEFMESI